MCSAASRENELVGQFFLCYQTVLQKEFTSYLGAVFSKFDYPVIHGLHGIVIDEIVQAGETSAISGYFSSVSPLTMGSM